MAFNRYNGGVLLTKFTGRSYASNPSFTVVFDRKVKLAQRERAASSPDVAVYDYLKDEIGFRLADRVYDVKRKFDRVVDLGCGRGYVSKHITKQAAREVVMCDSSQVVLDSAATPQEGVMYQKMCVDEEEFTMEKESVDLVVSCLSLHWVNDLPGTFSRILSCLKNDGVFLACLFGGDSLYELRSSLQLAELERCGGISVHISPFTKVRDIGSLLNMAGFTMLTIDTDEITVGYPSMFELMGDLKGMGESNASTKRCLHLKRDVMLAAAAIYQNLYGGEEKIRATFQIINFIAWKPDPSQPKPLQRGSGQISLKDLDKLQEIAEKTGYVKLDDQKDDK